VEPRADAATHSDPINEQRRSSTAGREIALDELVIVDEIRAVNFGITDNVAL
jgi:hypothetical protein